MTDARPVLYVIGFSAPPVLHLHEFLALLLDEGWDPWVILSPTAASWVDVERLSNLSGHAVRVEPRTPFERNALPPASFVIAAPLTFNSLNKWAAGISDTLALGLLNEALGRGLHITAALCVKKELQRHPAYAASQRTLTASGVVILPSAAVTIRPADDDTDFDWNAVQRECRSQYSLPHTDR